MSEETDFLIVPRYKSVFTDTPVQSLGSGGGGRLGKSYNQIRKKHMFNTCIDKGRTQNLDPGSVKPHHYSHYTTVPTY